MYGDMFSGIWKARLWVCVCCLGTGNLIFITFVCLYALSSRSFGSQICRKKSPSHRQTVACEGAGPVSHWSARSGPTIFLSASFALTNDRKSLVCRALLFSFFGLILHRRSRPHSVSELKKMALSYACTHLCR